MTLAPVVLDDLTWDQMVAAIRRRIPAESAGNWTLHAPVDPGITFLELFAFLAEQRLYWLDQVPDAFVVAVLELLGLGGPLPAVPAATVLQITAPDPQNPAVFTVAGRYRVHQGPTRRGGVHPRRSGDRAARPERLTLEAGGQDRTADLLAGRGLTCCPRTADPARPASASTSAAPVPGGELSLLFDLADPETPAGPDRPSRPPGPRIASTACRRPPSSPGPTPTARSTPPRSRTAPWDCGAPASSGCPSPRRGTRAPDSGRCC